MATLRRSILKEYEEASAKSGQIESEINNRVDEIINFIVEFEGLKLNTWYYQDAPEGGMGEIQIYNEDIYGVEVHVKDSSYNHFTYIIDGGEWSLDGCTIPVKWLFEDYKREISEGREKYLQKQEKKKQKRAERKKQKELKEKKLKESIKSKLSAEELKLLKI